LLVNQKRSHRCVQSFYPTPHSSPHWNLPLQRITQSVKAATCFAAFGFRVTLRCHVTTNAVLSSSGASRIGWNLLPGCWVAKWDEAFQFLWLRFLWLSCGWLPFRRPKPSWRMSKVPWQHPEFWPCTCQSEGKQKKLLRCSKNWKTGGSCFKWRFMTFCFEARFGNISNISKSSVCYESPWDFRDFKLVQRWPDQLMKKKKEQQLGWACRGQGTRRRGLTG